MIIALFQFIEKSYLYESDLSMMHSKHTFKNLIRYLLIFTILLFVNPVTAKSNKILVITPGILPAGETWPLTIPEISVDCSLIPAVVGVYKNKAYTMNGVAISHIGGPNILEVSKPDPEYSDIKMSSSRLLNYALKECG